MYKKLQLYTILISTFLFSYNAYCQSGIDSIKSETVKSFSDSIRKPETVKLKKKTTIWEDLKNDGIIYVTDFGAYIISPFRMNGTEFIWAGGMIATTALSMQFDLNVRERVNRGTNRTFNRDFWDLPTVYGFVQYPAMASGAMYITGLALRNKWIRVTARLWLEALSYSGGAVMLIRYIAGRTRPYYSDNPFKYTWFQTHNDTQAFPSGHTVVAFASSTILAHRIDNIFASIGLYALASLTAYSRLINNQHWLSDVIAGAVLGFTSAYFVMNREWNREKEEAALTDKKKKGKGGEKKFSLFPTFNGLGMSLRF